MISSLICSALWLTACAENPDHRAASHGVIARFSDGSVRRVLAEEQSQICAHNLCEPNFAYHTSFGWLFHHDSPKTAAATQAPAPAEPSDPTSTQDVLDYSRTLLKVESAWKLTEGSPDIVVAVIDTGVELTHPDLRDNLWINPGEVGGAPNTDNDGNGYANDLHGYDFVHHQADPTDDNKHGTHCAGIIAAELNHLGIAGIAPRVRIMPLKMMDSTGAGTTEDAVAAINYAVKMKANIISLSWGGSGYSQILNDAIQAAIQQGIMVVAAAGNETADNAQPSTPTYPANFPGVIAVAATDESDHLAPYSNFSPTLVSIAAPGSRILSSVLNGKWDHLDGTSMAAPQVSGALALALSLKPTIDRATLKDKLCSSAKSILLNRVRCGRLDVLGLLESL